MKYRPYLLTFLLFILGACASINSPVADRNKIRTIAVVSAVHDTVTLVYAGILTSHAEDVPVDWALRERLKDRLVSTLARTYQVRSLNENLAPMVSAATMFGRNNGFSFPASRVVELVKSHTKPGQVDAIVVAFDTEGAMYRCCFGGGGVDPRYVGFMYQVLVIDGKTFALLGSEAGGIARRGSTLLINYDLPAVDVDIGWRGEASSAMTPIMMNTIHYYLYGLIDESVPFTLRNRMHLIP